VFLPSQLPANVAISELHVLQRDVPGFTRAALPILFGQGVRAVTVGVNGGSAPPGVPHNEPFIWRDTQSQTDMLAMWHPGESP